MAKNSKQRMPTRVRHPKHPPAPEVPRDGVNRALLAVFNEFLARDSLTPARRAEGQRLFKRVRDWSRTSAARRSKLWHQIETAGVQAGLTSAQVREIATRPGDNAAADQGLEAPRGVHELTRTMRLEHIERRRIMIYKARKKSPAEMVRLMAGRRSRAWVYRVLKNLAKHGDVTDRRTIRRVRERRIPVKVSLLLESYCFRKNAKPTVTAVARQLKRACKEMNLRAPSESWVRQQLDLEPQLKLLWQHGRAAYERGHRPVTVRHLGFQPGELYQVDSTPLDVWLQEATPRGELTAIRPSLTAVTDVATSAVIGYHVTPGKVNGVSVLNAIVHALTPSDDLPGFHGKPQAIQFDGGSEATVDLRERLEAMGIEVLITPKKAPDLQGKVESSIGTTKDWLGEVPGYIPVVGGTLSAAQRIVHSLWSMDTFRGWLTDWMLEHNEVSIHRGLGMTRRMAWERGDRVTPATEEELLSLLSEARTVEISHGLVTVQEKYERVHYTADFLADLPSRRVELRYGRFGKLVHLFDPVTGRYLGPARALAADVSEQDIARIQRQRMELRERRKELLMPRIEPAELDGLSGADAAAQQRRVPLTESIEPSLPAPEDGLPIDADHPGVDLVAEPEVDEQVARLIALQRERAS